MPRISSADNTSVYGSFSNASNSTLVPFSFTLAGAATTSAGVFASDGRLLRTLWSGVPYSSGSHSVAWDGTGDDGRLLPNGSYTIRVLSNNVHYNWDGVVGNTSDSFTGSTVWHQYSPIADFAFTGTTGYVASGYSEGVSSQSKFAVSDPQSKTWILPLTQSSSQESWFVGTDGTTVYWGGDDPNSSGANNSFVIGTKVSDDTEQTFSSGTSMPTVSGRTYISAFDVVNSSNSLVTGLAVQPTGSFLFVARSGLNQIDVVNKSTGAVVTTNTTLTAPGQLAVDRENNLYVIHSSGSSRVVDKYTVNGAGAMSSAGVTVSGLLDPIAIAVAPDSSALVVADASTSQQLKAFSTTTASGLWTYGTANGYISSASVSNDKFYWRDARGTLPAFISFQTDGTFWVRDTGNDRILHFAADRSYLGQLMYVRHSYSAGVDRNDPTRVFSDYKEFSIDYSKALGPANGSWTLVDNWGGSVTSGFDDENYRLKSVATLSNGHTYALMKHPATGNLQVAELVPGGTLRMTGVETSGTGWDLAADGSLMTESCCNVGSAVTWKKRALSGFDGSNNPSWSSETTLATSPATTSKDPVYYGNGTGRFDQVTSSNVAVTFSNSLPPSGTDGYHLGGVAVGSTTWLWKASPSTFTQYNGTFPTDGYFDIGNNINYAGSAAMVSGRNVIWGYYGENWKSNQTNEFEHFYDDGLFVGEFGTTAYGILFGGKDEAAAGVAGNGYSPALIQASDGNLYVYHNDESMHGGVHRWSISNLSSISEQSIPVTFSPTAQGLLGQYFDSPQEDNAYLKTSRTDATVNFDWAGAIPSGTALSSAASYSVRWTGFVTPDYSESYTFYLKGNKGVRLWVDGTLLIDQWTNSSLTEYSGSITLAAGTSYPIRVEYQNTGASASTSLKWSSSSRTKQVIPADHMYPAPAPDTSSGIDLMQGLPFNASLASGQYGWSRSPTTDDTTDQFSDWWVVKSNDQTYVHGSPDVFARYRQNSATYTVTRDLGSTTPSLTSWHLSGFLGESFVAPNNDNGSSGGDYIEVLDASGKVITRFYQWASSGSNTRIQANDRTIVDDTNANVSRITLYNDIPQALDISMSGGTATFRYGPYGSVSTASLVDPSANWKAPRTLRLYFFTTNANYDRMIDLQAMRFQTVDPGLGSQTVSTPSLTTSAASSVTDTTVTLNGSIASDGNASSTSRGFEYGPTTGYGSNTSTSGTYGIGSFSADLTGLACNTTYHFRAFATNSAGTGYGSDQTFTTSACAATAPTVLQAAMSSITSTGATASSSITSTGGSAVTVRGFAWGTNTSYALGTTSSSGSFGVSSFQVSSSTLTCNATYHVRAYATNGVGTAYASDASFTTSSCAAAAPTLTTSAASSISTSSMTLNASISSTGGASITQSGFAYGTNSSLSSGSATTTLGSQGGTGSFSGAVTGLSANTTYYFRAYAANTAGTGYGSIVSAASLSISAPTVLQAAMSSITSTGATASSSITSTGGDVVTARGFAWGTNTSYALGTTSSSGSFGVSSFQTSTSTLACNTTYHVRAFSTSSGGTSYAADASLTTSSCAVTPPSVSTSPASAVSLTSMTLNANIPSLGSASVTQSGFAYGTSPSLAGAATTTLGAQGTGAFSGAISGLSSNTLYYFRAYAASTAGTSYGSILSTTTLGIMAPTVTVATPPSVSDSAATLSGAIAADGSASSTVRGFEYGISASYGSIVSSSGLFDIGPFSADVSSLTCNTQYHVRSFATNSAGTASSSDQTFTTSSCPTNTGGGGGGGGSTSSGGGGGGGGGGVPAGPISISNVSISGNTIVGVTVSWSTNVVGTSLIQYGASTAYGLTTVLDPSFITSHSQKIAGLASGATYHLQLRSKDAWGNLATSSDLVIVTSVAGSAALATPISSGPVSSPTQTVTSPAPAGAVLGSPITAWLVLGVTDPQAKTLQRILNATGYRVAASGAGSPGSESTYFGPATLAALQKFQCAKIQVCSGSPATTGYGATGPKTRTTLNAFLGSAAAPAVSAAQPATPVTAAPISGTITSWLYLGVTDTQVMALQKILNAKGYTVALSGTGSLGHESAYFGPATDAALKRFQCATISICSGSPDTTGYGATGPKTRAALNSR